MSEQRDYDRYLKGDLRVDGFKSEWRKDFEAYRERAPAIVRAVVPVAKAPTGKRTYTPRGQGAPGCEYMRKRRAEMKAKGICTDCSKTPAREGRLTCEPCQKTRTARETKRYHAKKAA
jgi:hypothetical protein